MIWLEDIGGDAVTFLLMKDYIIVDSQEESRDYLMVHITNKHKY
jgi:hypothetical protein